MYEYSKSAVLLDGERSDAFDVEQEDFCLQLRDVDYHQFVFHVYQWVVEGRKLRLGLS